MGTYYYFVGILAFNLVGALLVVASDDFTKFEEGHCQTYTPTETLNSTWFHTTTFPYLVAGSKYHLSRLVTTDSREYIPDYRFYYEACLESFIDPTSGDAHVISFGRKKNQFWVSPVSEGIIDFTENTRETKDTCRHYLTFTDNKSFVFFANCWMKGDQRSWDVISTKRELGEEEATLVEEHAMKLGFDKENFAFMKCWKWHENDVKS